MDKKNLLYIALAALMLTIVVFVVAFSNRQEKQVEEYIQRSHLKISQLDQDLLETSQVKLNLQKEYDVNQNIIEMKLINSSQSDYIYGYGYDLQIQYKGIWYTIPLNKEAIFPYVALQLPANQSASLEADLRNHIPLIPGKYRMIKAISKDNATQERAADEYIAAEFKLK